MNALVVLTLIGATHADLAALAQQKAWVELLEKAETVLPAERDDRWRGWVGAAAAEVARTAPVEKTDALAHRFTFLSAHAPFVAARDAAVVAALERCLAANDDLCFRAFVSVEKTLAPAGSLAAGKVLRHGGFQPQRAMVLFARAVGTKDAPACKDADVAEAVLAALDASPGTETAAAARQVAFDWCFTALAPQLKESMRGAGAARLENACAPMRAKKALTPLQDELCRDVDR